MLVAQITDTHISADEDGIAARSLTRCIAAINALRPRPDVVVLTGDTANTGTTGEYAVLRRILAGCEIALYVVPGNHDRPAALRAELPGSYFPGVVSGRLQYSVESTPVRLVGIDTTEPRRLGGYLDGASIAWLERTLAHAPLQPTLVFMHHPPFRTGVNAADIFGFYGLTRFRDIITTYPAVRRIVAGHIHCERRSAIATTAVTTCPSTTPQRVPELFERRLIGWRAEPAGFAVHAWVNGTFATTIYVATDDGRFTPR